MKKFISMVMAAAMVVSLVPATAFAASAETTATVKNVAKMTATEVVKESTKVTDNVTSEPELQLTIGQVDAKLGDPDTFEVTLKFGNVDVSGLTWGGGNLKANVHSKTTGAKIMDVRTSAVPVTGKTDEVLVTIKEGAADFQAGDVLMIELDGVWEKDSTGTKATVAVSGDFGKHDAMVFAEIVEEGITAELDDETADVAPEELTVIDPIVIKPNVGDTFDAVIDKTENYEITLKLNKGFAFTNTAFGIALDTTNFRSNDSTFGPFVTVDDDEIEIVFGADTLDAIEKVTISGLEVEADTAKAGDVANVTVKVANLPSVKVAEVAKVIDYKVVMSLVDPDEDVPVFYNGVNVENDGLTVDDDHEALEVNIKETFAGAWSNHKEFTLSLPAGVHVANITDISGNLLGATTAAGDRSEVETVLKAAYVKGDHEEFVFAKRVFDETNPADAAVDPTYELNEMEFVLVLVAEPDFVGDVVLTLEGAAMETQEVTIAKFVSPYTIKAEQNDVIIDYRHTSIDTPIVITEAEAGLWEEGLTVGFVVERGDMIQFEDDATVTVNEESGMEIDDEVVVRTSNVIGEVVTEDSTGAEIVTTISTWEDAEFIGFEVEEESDEEPAVITIDGIELFMQRNIPAGAYALEVGVNSATNAFLRQTLFAGDADEFFVADVDDFSDTVNEAFVNVVTAGREQSDSSFTTTVVVPVGESYVVAGDRQITLDVPAYINANGYIMVPVRAVANALGIANDCVQWNQASKTVIIMYGDRLITMTAGSSVIYVGGTPLPSTSSVEIVDGRAFLGLRDLANALGVKSIAWDPATKVGTLNPKA